MYLDLPSEPLLSSTARTISTGIDRLTATDLTLWGARALLLIPWRFRGTNSL